MKQEGVHTRYYVFALGCLGMLTMAMAGQLLSAALGPISGEFNRNLAQSGFMLLLSPLGFVFSTLVSGWLSDRWGQRPFILLGGGLLAAGLGLSAWSPDYHAFLAGIFLTGFSCGLLESPISAVVADAFPERRAQALNLTQIFYNIGAVLGPVLLGGALALGWGWRHGFGLCVILAVAGVVLGYGGLPKRREEEVSPGDSGEAPAIEWDVVWTAAAAIFLYVGAEMTIASWSAKYVQDTFGVAASRAALTVSGFWLGMATGRAAYIFIVGRFGYLPPLLVSAVLGAASAFMAASAGGGLWAGGACALAGFCLGGSWPTILGYVAHRNPRRLGTVFGIIVSAGAAGQVVFPPLSGLVAENSAHKIRAAMVLGGCVALLEAAVIVWMMIAERRRNRAVADGE